MKSTTPATPSEEATYVRTTLYELIEAISAKLPRDDDLTVAQAVLHLIRTGKIKFTGRASTRKVTWS
jgi:predicted DNA-binding protein